MNRRDFLKSILAVASAVATLPLVQWVKSRVIRVSPNGPLTLTQAVDMVEPGGIIFLEGSPHKVEGTIRVTKNISICGEGWEKTTVFVRNADQYLVYLESGCSLSGLTVEGNFK